MCCGWLAYRCVGSTILFIASTEHIVHKFISTRKKSVMPSRSRFPAKWFLSLELSRNRLSSPNVVMDDQVQGMPEFSSVSVMILSSFVTHWGNQSEKCHFPLIIKEPTPLMALIFTLTQTDHSLGKSHLNLLYQYAPSIGWRGSHITLLPPRGTILSEHDIHADPPEHHYCWHWDSEYEHPCWPGDSHCTS